MKSQQLPRAVHGVPAFLAGLPAALLAGMTVNGAAAVAGGEPLLATLVVTLGVALLAALPFGPLAAIAFLPVFLLLRAAHAYRPSLAATVFACLALALGMYMQSGPIGLLAFGASGLVFGWVSATVFAWAAARDAS